MKLKNSPVDKLIFCLLVVLLSACSLEEIQPKKNQQLTIAQNFMSIDQQNILLKMAKRKKIQLTIKHLPAKAIRTRLQNKPWDPGFDLILLDGLFEQQYLEDLSFQYKEPQFAAIPLGISYVPDSIVNVKHYQDLSSKFLWATADAKAKSVLQLYYAYAYRKRKQLPELQKHYRQIKQGFKDHELPFDTYLLPNALLVCRLDTHLHTLQKKVKKRQFTYGLTNPKAFFADYLGLYVVAQCANNELAKQFIRYLHFQQNRQSAFRNAFGLVAPSKKQKSIPIKELLKYRDK